MSSAGQGVTEDMNRESGSTRSPPAVSCHVLSVHDSSHVLVSSRNERHWKNCQAEEWDSLCPQPDFNKQLVSIR